MQHAGGQQPTSAYQEQVAVPSWRLGVGLGVGLSSVMHAEHLIATYKSSGNRADPRVGIRPAGGEATGAIRAIELQLSRAGPRSGPGRGQPALGPRSLMAPCLGAGSSILYSTDYCTRIRTVCHTRNITRPTACARQAKTLVRSYAARATRSCRESWEMGRSSSCGVRVACAPFKIHYSKPILG